MDIRLLSAMYRASDEDVRAAYIARMSDAKGKRRRSNDVMLSAGYEAVPDSGQITADGREIVRSAGVAWALRAEVHAARLAEAFETARKQQAEKQATQQSDVKEAIAAITCPQMAEGKPCGGALNRRGVCPSCVTGKMGYKYRYTCESCGCDIVTREPLK